MARKRRGGKLKRGKGFGKTIKSVGKFLLHALPTVAPLALAALGRRRRGRGYVGSNPYSYP